MLFETCIYIGKDPKRLKKIHLTAGDLRVSSDENEAIFGKHCCDLIFSIEGEGDKTRIISASSKFHCITNMLGHCREWVRGVVEDNDQADLYIEVEGELVELPLDMIFSTNDCMTWEMEDKMAFADANGYREDWQVMDTIEPSVACEYKIALVSDFGLIQIFDELFEDDDVPDWDERAHKDFASCVKGAVSLRVMENDDHEVRFELLGSEPVEDFERFLHVVDVPFLTTGLFEVADQPIRIKSGKYTLRWYVKQGKDGSWEHEMKMWPGKLRKVSVLKQFKESQ